MISTAPKHVFISCMHDINLSLMRVPRIHNGERLVPSTNGVRKTVCIHMHKNVIGPLFYIEQ